jgi:hypothetical protein
MTLEEIESSWEYAFEKNLRPKEKRDFILDYRRSHLDIEFGQHLAIADFYKKQLDVFGNHKIAIITEEPRDIVIPVLVKFHNEGYSSRPFSTLEAAIALMLSRI